MSERKPLIAVMGAHKLSVLYNENPVPAAALNETYANAVTRAGGIPVILPPFADDADLFRVMELCGGLLLPGGEDVDPRYFGEDPSPKLGRITGYYDRAWIAALEYAAEQGMPVLGICRGHQLANAVFGGTLYQDIPLQYPSKVNHHGRPPYDQPVHGIDIIKGTPLYECCGAHMEVNSYHHQAVKTLAPGLVAMAYAPDGLIEAVYDPQAHFLWAVQFHPEFAYRKDEKCRLIFEHFVDACRK